MLGSISGRTLLELGSGTGPNLAHLATLGATCVGVDIAPSRVAAARQNWGGRSNLDFVTADAVDYLTNTSMWFDVVYSIFGAVWFTDPARLLPLVRSRMVPGGVFAFSQLPAMAARSTTPDRLIRTWNHPAEQWARLLTDQGFHSVTAEIIPAPAAGRPGTLLVRAMTG